MKGSFGISIRRAIPSITPCAVLLCLTICLTIAKATGNEQQTVAKDARPVEFVDITKAAGLKWGIRTLAPGARYLIETMGGGGGFIDYNGDGLLDIYLVLLSQTTRLTRRPGSKMSLQQQRRWDFYRCHR
jgi:hypothetical protein